MDTVSVVLFNPARQGEAFASQDGRVFRSKDGGERWLALEAANDGRSWPSALFILPDAPDLLFALFPRRGVSSEMVELARF
jgi:hypothetical protein